MDTKKLITIAEFNEPVVAHMALAKLEANDIPCYLANENFAATYPLYAGSFSGVLLQVEQADVERALAILNEKTEDPAQ